MSWHADVPDIDNDLSNDLVAMEENFSYLKTQSDANAATIAALTGSSQIAYVTTGESVTSVAGGWADITALSLTLDAGLWVIFAKAQFASGISCDSKIYTPSATICSQNPGFGGFLTTGMLVGLTYLTEETTVKMALATNGYTANVVNAFADKNTVAVNHCSLMGAFRIA